MITRTRTFLTASFLLMTPMVQAALGWHGPEPFRLDRLDGRQFDYNKESFLQRLSFTEQPLQGQQLWWQQNGWYGSGGSSRGKEFYIHSLLQQRLTFDAPVFLGVRHKRSEDLDGVYDRTLFGAGYQSAQGWDLGIWGEVNAAKEDMDIQLEANRVFADGSWLTGAVVFTDLQYNSKTYGENRYQQYPITLYATGGTELAGQRLAAFVNLNLKARYDNLEQQQSFSDEQVSAGISWQRKLTEQHQLTLEAQGLYGQRSAEALTEQSEALSWQLTRRFQQLTLEWQWFAHAQQPALGLQASRLDENDSRFAAGDRAAEYRREAFAYFRLERPWSEQWSWRPTLYAGYASVRSELRIHSDEPLHDRAWLGKFSPNWVWHLSAQTGAYLLINPTVKLHNLQFGGGNIQVHIPF